jgi:hypothetical protein
MIDAINAADVVEQVSARFNAYNATLDGGDAAALNDFFWDSPSTVRFGRERRCSASQALPSSGLRAGRRRAPENWSK